MKRFLIFFPVAALFLTAACGRVPAGQGDPRIAAALAEVCTDSLRLYVDELVAFGTRHTLSTQSDPARGVGAAMTFLAERCQRWADEAPAGRPRPEVERISYTVGQNGGRYDRIAEVPELMVTLPGSRAEREILLLAHVDTRVVDVMDSTSFAPGADDDGSGVACLLEVVRILSRIPLDQTVKCLFVSGEEQGLDGSRHFARLAREQGWPVLAVLSNDMIGNTRASGTELREDRRVRVFSESPSGEDSPSRQLARYIQELARIYVPEQEVVLNYRSDRYRRGGDQLYFQREGFTAVRVCEYCEDYERTHQDVLTRDGVAYGDLPSYMDFPYLTRNVRVNLAAVMNLALAPATPENAVIANAGELDNNTILTWDEVPGAASYQILYRETDRSQWDILATVVGNGTFSCPLSKDNYYFAVRAVSPGGHPGLPAFAR